MAVSTTSAPTLRRSLALGLAFVASAATLVLELVAGRLLAPFVGVSLYTWTAIIGVVLAGISLGSWLGGRLADVQPSRRLLGLLFVLGGLASFATLLLTAALGDGSVVSAPPLLVRIFLLSTLLLLPPSLLLGMVTPLVIRLALPELRSTGRVVGLVYAAATLGSLVGNFLTGFVLTALLRVDTIVTLVGVVLILAGAMLLATGSTWQARSSPAPDQVDPAAPDLVSYSPKVEPAFGLAAAGAIVVVASFCSMAIELAASRIMAPYVGLSLYSWTGIIGVVLAGIALGNALGGRLADRWPRSEALAGCLLAGALASLAILPASALLDAGLDPGRPLIDLLAGWLPSVGLRSVDPSGARLILRIVGLTLLVFFLPILLLGTISPQVIRLTLTELGKAGRVAGQVYAWSVAGAIVGTFASGWYLISLFGVRGLVLGMGVVLLMLALAVAQPLARPGLALAVLLPGAVAVGLQVANGAQRSICTRETNYFCIRVHDTTHGGNPVRSLVLDHLVHSYVKIGDPSYLGYEHEYVQAELTRWALARTGAPRVLVIGGGGYTYPRWVEWALPQTRVEVVEIDPGVTQTVYEQLGLPPESEIVSYNLDGRQFVHELAPRGSYALVVQDAVNDLSVPYHLMTREYNDQVRALLAPGGAYLLTVIDLFDDGQLLRAAARTMRETFPAVQLLAASNAWESGGANVWVVAGSERGVDLEALRSQLLEQGLPPVRTRQLAPERLDAYLAAGPQIVLTDQYAPVDNLIAPLFSRRG